MWDSGPKGAGLVQAEGRCQQSSLMQQQLWWPRQELRDERTKVFAWHLLLSPHHELLVWATRAAPAPTALQTGSTWHLANSTDTARANLWILVPKVLGSSKLKPDVSRAVSCNRRTRSFTVLSLLSASARLRSSYTQHKRIANWQNPSCCPANVVHGKLML